MGTSRTWALPRLAGRAWWVFTAIWSALLALCLWSAAMVLPGIWDRVANPLSSSDAIGLAVYGVNGSSTIMATTPMAARAGLRRGDRVLLINGKPAAGGQRLLDRQLGEQAGERVAFVTASPSGVTSRHVVTRDPHSYRQASPRSASAPAYTDY